MAEEYESARAGWGEADAHVRVARAQDAKRINDLQSRLGQLQAQVNKVKGVQKGGWKDKGKGKKGKDKKGKSGKPPPAAPAAPPGKIDEAAKQSLRDKAFNTKPEERTKEQKTECA